MSKQFGVVILAAGASARYGRPKQLLPYLGRTLVEHAVRTAIASGAKEVIVVAGAEASVIRERLQGLPVRVVTNKDWSSGLSTSIRRGVSALSPEVDSVVIALCDQPKITPDLLRRLAYQQFESDVPIVASTYDGIIGAPAAFCRGLFSSLLALEGNFGARDLIRQSGIAFESIVFDGGNVDVDIPTDFRRLIPTATAPLPRDIVREPQDARAPPQLLLSASSPA